MLQHYQLARHDKVQPCVLVSLLHQSHSGSHVSHVEFPKQQVLILEDKVTLACQTYNHKRETCIHLNDISQRI